MDRDAIDQVGENRKKKVCASLYVVQGMWRGGSNQFSFGPAGVSLGYHRSSAVMGARSCQLGVKY